MSDFTVPDCLVLKLEEVEVNTREIDTTIYIWYDKNEHHFVIRGKRRSTSKNHSHTYSFVCEFAHELTDFLEYVICKTNKVNEILYNYDNLPLDSDEVTFEFLQKYEHSDYELSGYNGKIFHKKMVTKVLRNLRNIYNVY